MHILLITAPKLTKAGKKAERRHYKAMTVNGEKARVLTLKKLCDTEGISLPGLLQKLKAYPPGLHEHNFQVLIEKMKARAIGPRVAKDSNSVTCPHCHLQFDMRQSAPVHKHVWLVDDAEKLAEQKFNELLHKAA